MFARVIPPALYSAKAIRRIEDAGIAHKQAEAIVETFADAIEQLATKADIENLRTATKADVENLRTATKADLENLATATKADIENLATAMKADVENLATAMKADVENLRNEVNAKIDNLRNEMNAKFESMKYYLLVRMLLMQIGGIGLLFTLIKFFG